MRFAEWTVEALMNFTARTILIITKRLEGEREWLF
jgi:hypothetical protein